MAAGLCSMGAAALAADAPAIHARIAGMLAAKLPGGSTVAGLAMQSDMSSWPADQESFAYEWSGIDGSATVHASAAWAAKAGDDEAAFVLGHEMAHALCGHRFKELGLYAVRSGAVGLSLAQLAANADGDESFPYLMQTPAAAMEAEADILGASIARELRYDWRAGARAAVGGSKGSGAHASGELRIRAAEERLARPGSDPRTLSLQCRTRAPEAY